METIPWEVDSSKFSDSYVAGFLDGDGSIVATVARRKEKRRFPYKIILRINFTQHSRHKIMLVALQRYLGGIGSIREVASHNLAELVIMDREQVKTLLLRLLPHLMIKNRQARLMLQAIAIFESRKVKVRSRLSEKDLRKIIKLIIKIRGLNSPTGGKRNLDFELFDPVTTQPITAGVIAQSDS